MGREFSLSLGLNEVAFWLEIVNSSGAVSPAARATASSAPVSSPARAVGSTTRTTIRQRGDPRARAASRRESGTRSRTTSAERVTTGSMSSARATEPFQPANGTPPHWLTTSVT